MAPGFSQLPEDRETKETVSNEEGVDMSEGYKPQLTYVSYDGGILHAEWAANIPPRFSGFTVNVRQVDGPTEEYPSQGSVWEKELQLSSTQTYTLQVIVMVSGQPAYASDEVTLITSSPQVYSVIYADSLLQLYWAAARGAGVEAYAATLEEVGKHTWNEYTADLRTQFGRTLKITGEYRVSVRATNRDATVLGPSGTIYTPIAGAPAVTSVYYDKGKLTLTWAPAGGGGVQAYLAILEEVGKKKWNQSTQKLTIVFERELQQTGTYHVAVRASDSSGVVLGPLGNIYVPIVVPVNLTLVSYRDSKLTLSWDAAVGEGVQAYLATLEEVGKKKWNQSTQELTAVFERELQQTGTYHVAVRASDSSGVVLGPPSEILAPLVTSPGDPRLDYTGTELVAQWAADTNPLTTAYLIQLYKDDSQLDQQSPDTATADFNYQLEDGCVYKTHVRSTGYKVEGPWTDWTLGPYAAVVNYEYDERCRIKIITWNQKNIITYNLDDPGNILTVGYSESSVS
jgi:hypothetical protein